MLVGVTPAPPQAPSTPGGAAPPAKAPAGAQEEEAHRAYFISAADARQEPGEEPGEGARARANRGAAGQKEADRHDVIVRVVVAGV